MADVKPKVGNLVQTQDGRQGIVRYVGPLSKIAVGEWLGLELSDASGKNDGSVKGERYFTCPPGYGIFVRKESVVEVITQRAPPGTTSANGDAVPPLAGVATRPYPTGGITAEVARKRQSIMSAGSGGGPPGSRLSTRSPTKSPMKPIKSSSTSAGSTPRTGTPAMAARPSDSSSKTRMSIGPKLSAATRNTVTRTASHTSRPSMGSLNKEATRTITRTERPSLGSHRLPSQSTDPIIRQEKTEHSTTTQDQLQSPTIEEEETIDDTTAESRGAAEGEHGYTRAPSFQESQPIPATQTSSNTQKVFISGNTGGGGVEVRTAQQREVEELKAKLRTIEKKIHEDREKLQHYETIQSERDKFEKIMQALQRKVNASNQETSRLRARCDEAEAKAKAAPELSAEHESEIELAVLDKEMAEERAENVRTELEALRSRHEELELEIEILREENRELGSVMTPDEKANAGWLQMERERQRLREALVMLRDMSQQTETDLRHEIKELSGNLEEAETMANMYTETAAKLTRAEETNHLLKEQLEAVESNDEVVEAMEVQREEQSSSIAQLKRQIQDLEEHIQVTDELEIFHVDEEKRLHTQLDDTEALLSESGRQKLEQDKIIGDLEYTLTKFRDVVQGLQNDIDDLRRSRNISEVEAHEMSSRSRAMMDLNLRLQTNVAKSQTKIIDTELDKIQAVLAGKHVEILSLFAVETFESEKNSVSALLCFSRIKFKASLLGRLLSDRLKERAHLSHGEEIFYTFDVIEKMQWIAGACRRFEEFMNFCAQTEFSACGRALYELEPVERSITAWLEAQKCDELGTEEPEHFKRMQGIMIDLAEKLIIETSQNKAVELLFHIQMVENYTDSLANQLSTITKLVQTRLGGPTEADEDSLVFDRKMDHISSKSRTVKYLASKVVLRVNDLRSRSMCLVETNWETFEAAERQAENLAADLRGACLAVAREISKLDIDQPLSYAMVNELMLATWTSAQEQHVGSRNGDHSDSDVFTLLATRLTNLQFVVDDLMIKSDDVGASITFEANTSPWIVRARELKAQKTISPETQEELVSLSRRNNELGSRVAEREKVIEEMTLRVELAEKRTKDSRARDDKDKALKEEIDLLQTEKVSATSTLSDLRLELKTLTQKLEADNLELESLKKAAQINSTQTTSVPTLADQELIDQLQSRITNLSTTITTLQSAICFLHAENHTLRIPVSETLLHAAKTSWLDPSLLPSTQPSAQTPRTTHLQRESTDLYTNLITLAASFKPIRLSPPKPPQKRNPYEAVSSSWQPTHQTTRYNVLKQKEEIAKWDAWRDDLIAGAKIARRSRRTKDDESRMVGLLGRPDGRGRPVNGGGNLTDHIRGLGSGHRVKMQTGGDGNGDGVVVIVE